MQELNQLKLSGTITRIYELITTPAGINVSRFILEHSSRQIEAKNQRLVRCKMYCVQISTHLDNELLEKRVNVTGFLNMNSKQQLVLHVNNLEILD